MGFLSKKKKYFILSIDSGGIGSLFPLLILEKLQEELRMQGSSKSLTQCFDMIIGSGSGSITAAVFFFMDDMRGHLRGTSSKIYNTIHALSEHYFDPLEHYLFRSNENIESTVLRKQHHLMQELEKIFVDKGLLSMASPTFYLPVLDSITYNTVMLSGDTNYTISLYNALVLANQHVFLSPKHEMHNFEQHIHIPQVNTQDYEEGLTVKYSRFVNISLAARNPTLLAYHYLQKEQSIHAEYYVLSLGTGMFPLVYPVFDVEQHLLYTSIQSQNSMNQQHIQAISTINYYRIDGEVQLKQEHTNKDISPYASQRKNIYTPIFNDMYPLEKKEYIVQLFEKTGIHIVHKAIPTLREFVAKLIRE